ncbi:DUF6207 family protein [Streptomyces sp. NPDC006879]|uniref:DUF6207 family protein n=1 Tax=Streptomyces sp. NPDC006879 TaxID=3364767 RepID=UPI003689F8E4
MSLRYAVSDDHLGLGTLTKQGFARIEIVAGDEDTVQQVAGAIRTLGISPSGSCRVWQVPGKVGVRTRTWIDIAPEGTAGE